jgi:hypothetical protein
MKKLIKSVLLVCAIPMIISSCSVMKHKKESHTESSTAITQGSSSSTASVDTSKNVTTEYLRMYFPGAKLNAQPSPQTFLPLIMPDLTGATDDQRQAAVEMQKQFNELRNAFNSQGEALHAARAGESGIMLELMRQKQENSGKSTSEQKQDSTNYQHQEKADASEKEKTEQLDLWKILALAAIVAFIVVKVSK